MKKGPSPVSRISTRVAAILTTVAAAGALTGCSVLEQFQQPEEQQASEEQATSEVPEEEKYDTGQYRKEPHPGWPETPVDMTSYSEGNQIGYQTLLPYEVDPERFTQGRMPVRYNTFGRISLVFPDAVNEATKPFEKNYISGYIHPASDEDGNQIAENYIWRFTDPTSAEGFANAIRDTYLAEGGINWEDDTTYPLEYIDIPGHPGAAGMKDEEGDQVHMVTTYNEFVIFANAMDNRDLDMAEEEKNQDLTWAVDYMSKFLTMQLPMMDDIETHKTEEGFGKHDKLQPMDPDNILKYVVMSPEGVEMNGPVPAHMNKRAMNGMFKATGEVSRLLDQADIEAMAIGESTLFRLANPQNAEMMLASFRALDSEDEPEKFDEPQGVPGTECYSTYEGSGKLHYCYLKYENYYAHISKFENTSANSEATIGNDPEEEANKVDPKTQLSQMVAAQYLMLRAAVAEAEGNADGAAESSAGNTAEKTAENSAENTAENNADSAAKTLSETTAETPAAES